MFLGGIWGVGHRLHLVCTLQESWEEQKAGEGAEEVGHRLGQEASQAAYKMYSSSVFGGTRFGTILCKKTDAVNKKSFRSEALALENGLF